MKTRSLKLPGELDSRLTEYARRRKLTRSAVVREAVGAYLARQDDNVPAGAALERLRDLAGSVDGPPDLSTNPDYLLPYGARRSVRSKRRRARSDAHHSS